MRQNRGNDLREVIMNLAPAYEQWYANTIAEGEQIGITKGEQIGLTKGKQETARRMLSKNMSLEEIADLTDLTIAQIQALQTEN
jgi:predicted transposase/invertase (TIGR01784 family)